MAQATQPYRRSLSGSIGAGMKSVFGGGGRTYYMLVHKVSSKYHKAGESQPIIVDQIELGRDSKCQVRFDESFPTVSRRHAAIVKDGDKWKLVQLSTTNSTYLNGQKVHKNGICKMVMKSSFRPMAPNSASWCLKAREAR